MRWFRKYKKNTRWLLTLSSLLQQRGTGGRGEEERDNGWTDMLCQFTSHSSCIPPKKTTNPKVFFIRFPQVPSFFLLFLSVNNLNRFKWKFLLFGDAAMKRIHHKAKGQSSLSLFLSLFLFAICFLFLCFKKIEGLIIVLLRRTRSTRFFRKFICPLLTSQKKKKMTGRSVANCRMDGWMTKSKSWSRFYGISSFSGCPRNGKTGNDTRFRKLNFFLMKDKNTSYSRIRKERRKKEKTGKKNISWIVKGLEGVEKGVQRWIRRIFKRVLIFYLFYFILLYIHT